MNGEGREGANKAADFNIRLKSTKQPNEEARGKEAVALIWGKIIPPLNGNVPT